MEDVAPQHLEQCSYCGRNFNPQSLARHENICAKTSQKNRKVFDSSKQRTLEDDLKVKPRQTRTAQAKSTSPAKKSNWREKHDDFINSIRAARNAEIATKKGEPLPPPPPPTYNPDYVQCPFCNRRFQENAAERHIPFCKEQHERLPHKKVDATASSRLAIRTQYRAPLPQSRSNHCPGSSGHSSYGTRSQSKQSSSNTRAGTTSAGMNRNTNAKSGTTSAGTNRNTNAKSVSNHSYATSQKNESSTHRERTVGSGRALRTGRTAENYTEGRQLSAKQQHHNSHSLRSSNMPASPYDRQHYDSSAYEGNSYGSRLRNDGGYHSNSDNDSMMSSGSNRGSAARFCHECGTKYPVPHAKFCCECGIKRVIIR